MHALIMPDNGVRRERRRGWPASSFATLRRGRSENPCGSIRVTSLCYIGGMHAAHRVAEEYIYIYRGAAAALTSHTWVTPRNYYYYYHYLFNDPLLRYSVERSGGGWHSTCSSTGPVKRSSPGTRVSWRNRSEPPRACGFRKSYSAYPNKRACG